MAVSCRVDRANKAHELHMNIIVSQFTGIFVIACRLGALSRIKSGDVAHFRPEDESGFSEHLSGMTNSLQDNRRDSSIALSRV